MGGGGWQLEGQVWGSPQLTTRQGSPVASRWVLGSHLSPLPGWTGDRRHVTYLPLPHPAFPVSGDCWEDMFRSVNGHCGTWTGTDGAWGEGGGQDSERVPAPLQGG